MKEIRLNEAAVYVGTYHKYNNGSIYGKWLTLSNYTDKDEFIEACAELHNDESDAEYMFQDWEYIPDALIDESYISDKFWNITEAIDENSINEEAFFIYIDKKGYDINKEDINDIINNYNEDYKGYFDSEEDYARDIVEECYDLSEFAKTYFDYEAFAKDLFITDYYYEDGYVFSNY